MLIWSQNQIVARSNNNTEITSILDSMLASIATQVKNTHSDTEVINKFINKTEYDTLIAP